MASALPFPDENGGFKYMADMTGNDMAIMASKKIINVLYKWKEMGIDASGNKYEPTQQVETLSNALSVLEMARLLTISQKEAIINHLMKNG